MEQKSLKLGNLEYLILNYSITDRSFWLKIFEALKTEFFEKEENRQVFNFFKSYFSKYNQLPDFQITTNELRDVDAQFVSDIYGKPPEDTKSYIYDKTLEFVKHNLMIQALTKSIDLLDKGKFDEIEAQIKEVVKFNLDTRLGVQLSDIDKRYERIRALETDRIPSGFPLLDAILHGGWGGKEIYAVATGPGVGKSIFLANWAVAAVKQGYNALVYTLEISEERLSMRHDAILTKIPVDELTLDLEKVKEKYRMFAKVTKAGLWVKEFPTKQASVNSLKGHYEQLLTYENFKPDVIFVDYAGLMKPTFRVGDSYEDLKTIFEDLRGWAVELNIPIVTAAQTNRKSLDEKGGTKEIITQAQVAESLGITQTLDLFMTITQSRTEKEEGLINLYIDKHRHGESSKMLKYNIDYRNFVLEEVDV
jgi:replicative DNA helicase